MAAAARITRELAALRARPRDSCLVPGLTALAELLRAGHAPTLVGSTDEASEAVSRLLQEHGVQAERIVVKRAAAARIIGVDTVTDGVFARVPVPQADLQRGPPLRRLVVLDGLRDPGNVGTLVRTADALGWDAIFVCRPAVSPLNDKVIRAAAGALFRLPWQMGSWADLDAIMARHGIRRALLADVSGGVAVDNVGPVSEPLALVLSSEAHGPSPEARRRFDNASVHIPMRADRDSLNVAVAGGILMHRLL